MSVYATASPSTANPQPARLRTVGWPVWRLHRAALLSAAALLGCAASALVWSGLAFRHAYRVDGLASCGNLSAPSCQAPLDTFIRDWGSWPQLLPEVLWLLPAALGVLIGAPLIARDLESGFFRFRWTQATSRTRQLVAELGLLVAVLAIGCLVLSLVAAWWYAPWTPILGRMQGQAYEIVGLVFAARVVLGLAIGALAGAVLRRTVAALAVSALLWLVISVGTAVFIRPHLGRAVTVRADSDVRARRGLNIDQWVTTPAGIRLSANQLDRLDTAAGPDLVRTNQSFDSWLAARGYAKWVKYQPDSRFWTMQAIEAAGTLTAAISLAGSAIYLVKRRDWP